MPHQSQQSANSFTDLAQHVGIHVLEDFVESKLAEALRRVSERSGGPAFPELPDSGFPHGHPETFDEVSVFAWVDLYPALDQIKRNDGCVSNPTA